MEANSDSLWLVVGVVMLGPILLLVAAGGVVLWARSWRGRAERAGAQTSALAGQARDLLAQLSEFREEYAAVGRAAYTRMAADLDQAASDVSARMDELPGLLEALDRVEQDRPESGWAAVTGSFQTSGERRRICIALEHGRKALAAQMEQASALLQTLEGRPLEIQRRVQAAREDISTLEQTLDELRGWGLDGWAEAGEVLKQARGLSLQIPVALSENSALPRPDLFEMTSHGIEILDELEPLLAKWLREASGWSEQYQLGNDSFERILRNLTHLRAVTSAAPPLLLDISNFIFHLDQLEDRVQTQFELFQSSGVRDLGRYVRAAARFENTLRASSEEHDRACLEALNLERKLAELESKYAALEAGLTRQGRSDFHLERDQSRARLDLLDSQMDALRPFEVKLLPDALTARSGLASEMLGALENLEKEMKKRRERFDELVGLLQSSDIQTGAAWITSARAELQKAQETRTEGWSWRAKTDSLLRALDGLEALQARVAPAGLPVSILESDLDGYLDQAQRLADLHIKSRAQAAQLLRTRN